MTTGMSPELELDNADLEPRKTATIDMELLKRNVDIAALQETRLSDAGTIKEENYTFFWFGKPAGEPRTHGTGFAVRNYHIGSIQTPMAVNERLSSLRLNTRLGQILVISAYAPTLNYAASDKDLFYNQLEDLLRTSAETNRIVLLGDMNARVGSDYNSWPDCIGKFGVGNMNENGQRLLELCCRQNLCITNTMFPGKPHRKQTWCHPRSKSWHQLDFVLVKQRYKQEVRNTRTYHSADCDTDHSLVCSTMSLQPKPFHRQKKQSAKIDIQKTTMPVLNEAFCDSLASAMDSLPAVTDPDVYWGSLRKTIRETALATYGKKVKQNPDWYNASLPIIQPVLEEKRKALLRLKARPTRQARIAHRSARANAQRVLRACARKYWDSICLDIEMARDRGDTRGLYAGIKKATGPTAQTCGVLKQKDGTVIKDKSEKLGRWVEHFSELYTGQSQVSSDIIASLPNAPPMNDLDSEPDLEEVTAAIKRMPHGKAAGEDAIPAELLKAGIEPLAERLRHLVSLCWSARRVPQEFKNAKITTLYKQKGDRGDCNNYRGISLLSVTGKLLARLVLARLQVLAEEIYPEAQCGFRAGRSTTDMIFSVRQLQEKAREQQQPLHIAFVDLTKAFDLVDRQSLFVVLQKAGCPPTLLSLIRSFHEGMQGCVQYDGDLSNTFPINRGVKQGCVLAPTLFGIYFSFVFQRAFINLPNSTGVSLLTRDDGNFFSVSRFKAKTRVQHFITRELLYADDAALCANSPRQLQELLDGFSQSCADFGLTISLKKTVTLSAEPHDNHQFTINDTTLDRVNKFTYLGSTMTSNATLDQEISVRLGKAASTFGRLSKRVWNNKQLSICTKVRVYDACVLSVLLYGAETWPTYRRQESRLSAFHTRCLRSILGVTWKDKLSNEELFKITKSQPLSSRLKFIRLRWAGHITRMEPHRLPRSIFYGALEQGDRPVGRPRLRFKDVLKRDLIDFQIPTRSWSQLASNRSGWRSMLHDGMRHDHQQTDNKMRRGRRL